MQIATLRKLDGLYCVYKTQHLRDKMDFKTKKLQEIKKVIVQF